MSITLELTPGEVKEIKLALELSLEELHDLVASYVTDPDHAMWEAAIATITSLLSRDELYGPNE